MSLFSFEIEDLWKILDRNGVQFKKCRKSFGDTDKGVVGIRYENYIVPGWRKSGRTVHPSIKTLFICLSVRRFIDRFKNLIYCIHSLTALIEGILPMILTSPSITTPGVIVTP